MPNDPSNRGLSFRCSRRDLWPALLQELRVLYGSVKGGQGGRLSDLHALSDDQLAHVRPVLNPAYEIYPEEDYICCRLRETTKTRRLFKMEKENLITFNQFNGQHNLREIGERLSREIGWDEAEGFAYVRYLFLALGDRLVCLPKDPPPIATAPPPNE